MKETIETLYGNDEITNRTLQVFESTQKSIEGITGKDEIAMHVAHDWHMNGLLKLRKKSSNQGCYSGHYRKFVFL